MRRKIRTASLIARPFLFVFLVGHLLPHTSLAWEADSFPDADLETPYRIEIVARDLRIPWSLAFAPDGRLFLTERQGRVRVVEDGVLRPEPAFEAEVPRQSTNGFLGLAVRPEFEKNHLIYLAYNYWEDERPKLKVVRFRESDNRFTDPRVIIDDLPAWHNHTGCRLRFGPDGKLYLTVGDADKPPLTQRLDLLNGKILRLNDDGTIPEDNPFVGRDGARSEVFSYGHRNGQGLAFHPETGELWETEHGAGFRDELNRIEPGGNYGWSVIEGEETAEGMLAPALSMNVRPAYAPSAIEFATGRAFPELKNAGLIAIMQGQGVLWVKTEGARVTDARLLFRQRFGRVRDVVEAADGSLYLALSLYDNRGLRITAPPADFDMVVRIVPADWPAGPYPVLDADYSLNAPIEPQTFTEDGSVPQLIARYCESCHGEGLKGGMQSSLLDGEWKLAPDPNTRYYVIANGLADRSMPAFGDELTPEQIHAIMQFIVRGEGLR